MVMLMKATSAKGTLFPDVWVRSSPMLYSQRASTVVPGSICAQITDLLDWFGLCETVERSLPIGFSSWFLKHVSLLDLQLQRHPCQSMSKLLTQNFHYSKFSFRKGALLLQISSISPHVEGNGQEHPTICWTQRMVSLQDQSAGARTQMNCVYIIPPRIMVEEWRPPCSKSMDNLGSHLKGFSKGFPWLAFYYLSRYVVLSKYRLM